MQHSLSASPRRDKKRPAKTSTIQRCLLEPRTNSRGLLWIKFDMNRSLQKEAVAEQSRVGSVLGRAPFGTTTLHVKRTGVMLTPDRSRVLVRPFNSMSESRAVNICARVLALTGEEVHVLLEEVLSE